MHRISAVGLALALTFTLGGCRGKQIARADLKAPGKATARFTAVNKVAYKLWADTDGTWAGTKRSNFPATYTVDVQQGGKSIGRLQCDTRAATVSVCGSHSNIFGEHSADCEHQLDCALPKLAPGPVVLSVEGRVAEPARVKKVRDMSIIVRED